MNIIQVNSHTSYSSIGRTTSEMHEVLLAQGHNAHVFCINESKEENNIHKVLSFFEYRINGIHSRITGLQAYASWLPTKRMLRKWDKIKPDAVILRNLHSDYVNLPLLLDYCNKNDVAVIIVLHDCWFFTGHCALYMAINCNKWKTMCCNCPGLKNGNPSWFFDRSNKIFKDRLKQFGALNKLYVVGVSKWITNEARQSPIFAKAKEILHIYNWISLDIFKPKDTYHLREKHGIENDFVILGVAQNWSRAKGFFVFVDIAHRLKDFKVVLIGNIKTELQKYMPENVIATGVLSSTSERADYFSMSDVFVNPTLQETFGKVTAEALSCGTPCVVNDTTATPEIVGDCGYIVHNNNIEQLIEGINFIHVKGKQHFVEKCRNRAEALFDKNKNISQYLQLFNRLKR